MRRIGCAMLTVLVLSSGCVSASKTSAPAGNQPSVAAPTDVTPAVGESSWPSTASRSATSSASAPVTKTVSIDVWFTSADKLFPTTRTRPATSATSTLALNELIAGPTVQERSARLANGIAPSTTFDLSIARGVATLSLPPAFYGGGRDAARLRQAQVVYTLTQFPTVSKIGFQRDGEALSWPVGRDDYADLLPAIVVTSPRIGQHVTSPVTVAGDANVFEATVSMRILNASGALVGRGFTTATCGTGCRGTYSMTLRYTSVTEQAGTVQVFEVSAKDGSLLHLVNIPVTLAASS